MWVSKKVVVSQKCLFIEFIKGLFLLSIDRIIDNMPVTWCYDVADETAKYCSTGFPIGCHVSEDGQARDACVTSVSFI